MGTRKLGATAVAVLVLLITSRTALPGSSHQKHNGPPSPQAELPPANPDDVRSIDSILAAAYDVISGPAGQKRDWNRLRSLCVPDARLIAVGRGPKGEVVTHHFSIEEYIARAEPVMERSGFYEREIARRMDAFDHIAAVFSTYESRHALSEKPFQRGINSFQLLNDGHRWWVVTIFWEPESPGHPLPKKYLSSR